MSRKPKMSDEERKEAKQKYMAEYRRKNADKIRKREADYNLKNAGKIQKREAEYRLKNADKIRKWHAEYKLKNQDKIRKRNAKYDKKPEVKIVHAQRARLKRIVKSTSVSRHEMTGCTPMQLRKHIESQFVKGMTWKNQGRWHIDHIMPCSAFDLTKPEQVKVCFNWQNLRPIWAKKNLRKGKKITHPQLCLPIEITQQTNQEKQ